MTIKNTSSKIISIGKTVLLPGDSMDVSEAIANAPAIKAMIGRGQLTIKANKGTRPKTPGRKKEKEAAEKKAAEEAAQAAE